MTKHNSGVSQAANASAFFQIPSLVQQAAPCHSLTPKNVCGRLPQALDDENRFLYEKGKIQNPIDNISYTPLKRRLAVTGNGRHRRWLKSEHRDCGRMGVEEIRLPCPTEAFTSLD